MVWYFIGVYIIITRRIIIRTLHGRLEIRNFFSRVEKIFHSKRNFVSPSGRVISAISIFFSFLSLLINQKRGALFIQHGKTFIKKKMAPDFLSSLFSTIHPFGQPSPRPYKTAQSVKKKISCSRWLKNSCYFFKRCLRNNVNEKLLKTRSSGFCNSVV